MLVAVAGVVSTRVVLVCPKFGLEIKSSSFVVVVVVVLAVVVVRVVVVRVVLVVPAVVVDAVCCLFETFFLPGFSLEAAPPPELVLVEVEDPAAAAAVQPAELQDVEVEDPPDGCCC